ncbi:MAG: tetratricopeptide repeat protein [Bdellovibrionales bacterium]
MKDPVYDEYEGLDLVAALVRDGKLKMAEDELAKYKAPSERRSEVTGRLQFAKGEMKKAITAFQAMKPSPLRALYLARSHYALKDLGAAHTQFQLSQQEWTNLESDVIARAACSFFAKESDAALAALENGYKKFHSFALAREKVALLLELGLAKTALEYSLALPTEPSVTESLALADLFYQRGEATAALQILEWTRLRYPEDVETQVSLAKAYFDRGSLRSTAEAFERAAILDGQYAYHAAEIQRQVGNPQRARFWIPQIREAKDQLRSKIALNVDLSQYTQMAALDAVVSTSPLIEDEEVRYALGYSLARLGQRARALKYLSGLKGEKATRVRESLK